MSKATVKTPRAIEFFVSPIGNDRWSGRRPAPTARKTDGPFATIERAQKAIRALKVKNELPVAEKVLLREGTYELKKTLQFSGRDSGSMRKSDFEPQRDVTYAAFPGEHPVLSGGTRLTGWKPTQIHGHDAWVCTLPRVKSGQWNFKQLWVNGRRASRPGTDKHNRLHIAELLGKVRWEGTSQQTIFLGQDQFRFNEGDLRAWHNVQDIEFVGLHYWIESRINFARIDPGTRIATLKEKSRMRLSDDNGRAGAQYYVENVFELLHKPGQWYFDRPRGKLYYLPRKGEKIDTAQVYAPRLGQLAIFQGTPEEPIEHIRLEGLTFSHTEWQPGAEAKTATPQAACHIPGAVVFNRSQHCRMDQCAITHIGSYGVEIGQGSWDVQVLGCEITDLSGGGVKIWHAPAPGLNSSGGDDRVATQSCQRITIADCRIADGGHRNHQAVGVLVGMCSGVRILHNHIHDFDYTGISVGWTWGYAQGNAYGNVIEHNHVHDIGRGMLSDMGGIYTLGAQPGTRIRYNIFHDIVSRGYGGWGIYTDEGSSDILIEKNLVYRTSHCGFDQHYGCNNIVCNNIFAFGRESQFRRARLEPHDSFILTRNIFYFDNDDARAVGGDWSENRARIDHNLYWHRRRKPLDFAGMTVKKWQARGLDRNSLFVDPLFVDPANGDFALKPSSPAFKTGFEPFDLSRVGPRTNRRTRGHGKGC